MSRNLKDVKFEYYKASGPGGQHKNKRFTAVRVTHLPSGISVVCADQRSQAANKKIALARLMRKWARLHKPRKARISVKMPRHVKEKILAWKKKHSLKKKARRRTGDFEE
ncbi:MAG: peptide chain release factor-like protein [Candidatus Omnitrophota bacterium]